MARLSAFLLTTMTLHIELILCTQYRNGDVSSPFIFYLDDYILSHGGLARLMLQGGDGNLVMRQYASSSWSYGGWATGTDPNGDHVELQEDGALVVFDATGGVLWQSNAIAGTAPFRLIVTDDVETYILDSLDKIVWSTNPSFASFEAVWTEPFNSNDMGWSGGDLTFSSTSPHCPNYPDVCLKLPWANLMGDSRSWADIYDTDISMYKSIQLQIDITGYGLQGNGEACEIWWSFDAPLWNDWALYKTLYPSGVFNDIIIDISLPSSYTSIGISLSIIGNSNADQCYFDNAILRGIRTHPIPVNVPTKDPSEPSQAPTTHPTTPQPTQTPTASPTRNPSNVPTSSPSNNPTTNPITRPSVSPTRNPSLHRIHIRHPSVSPTKATIMHSTQRTSSSSVTDTTYLAGNVIRDANDWSTPLTRMIVIVILSSLCLVCACLVLWILVLMKRNPIVSKSKVNDVEPGLPRVATNNTPIVMFVGEDERKDNEEDSNDSLYINNGPSNDSLYINKDRTTTGDDTNQVQAVYNTMMNRKPPMHSNQTLPMRNMIPLALLVRDGDIKTTGANDKVWQEFEREKKLKNVNMSNDSEMGYTNEGPNDLVTENRDGAEKKTTMRVRGTRTRTQNQNIKKAEQ